jgi:hypothetical protein
VRPDLLSSRSHIPISKKRGNDGGSHHFFALKKVSLQQVLHHSPRKNKSTIFFSPASPHHHACPLADSLQRCPHMGFVHQDNRWRTRATRRRAHRCLWTRSSTTCSRRCSPQTRCQTNAWPPSSTARGTALSLSSARRPRSDCRTTIALHCGTQPGCHLSNILAASPILLGAHRLGAWVKHGRRALRHALQGKAPVVNPER